MRGAERPPSLSYLLRLVVANQISPYILPSRVSLSLYLERSALRNNICVISIQLEKTSKVSPVVHIFSSKTLKTLKEPNTVVTFTQK